MSSRVRKITNESVTKAETIPSFRANTVEALLILLRFFSRTESVVLNLPRRWRSMGQKLLVFLLERDSEAISRRKKG